MTRTEAAQLINERTGHTWTADEVDDSLDALRDGLLSKVSLGTTHGWLTAAGSNYTFKARRR